MEKIAWHQVFSNYHNLSLKPNNKVAKFRVKQNLEGLSIRVELSNQYDSVPLYIESIRISLSEDFRDSAIMMLDNQRQFAIPPNQKLWTDKVELKILRGQNLWIELKVQNENDRLATSAYLASRNIITSNICLEDNKVDTIIYGITSIAVETEQLDPITVGFFGDSLTNQAYFSDQVLQILYSMNINITGFNAGISGNRLLLPGTSDSPYRDSFGNAGMNRFREDVIAYTPNVVIGLIGVNDLFQADVSENNGELPTVEQMIKGYQRLLNEAEVNNILYVALTIPPFAKAMYHEKAAWNENKESIRLKVNQWLIENSTTIDIANFVSDENPAVLAKEFDCGDGLHFSQKGGEKIGKFVAEQLQNKLKNIKKGRS